MPDELQKKLKELMTLPSETEWVEFKEAKTNIHFDDLGKYFSALSNETNLRGLEFGWLVLGISNKPPRRIVGTSYRPSRPSLDSLKKEIADHTTNRHSFKEIHELNLPEGRVLMLQIPPALQGIPTSWKGHYYGREGESLGALSLNKIEHIRSQEPQDDWSSRICGNASLNDLDPSAVRFAKKQYREKHFERAEEIDQWDDITFLNKSKVFINGKVTHAALVLLGSEEAAHFLSPAVAHISWVLRDAQGMERDYAHFRPPLILAVDQVFEKVRNLTYRYLPNASLFPVEVTQYDPWVLRESLHNAIAHQDYTKGGRINVVENPESLLISNLGNFIPGSVEEVIRRDAPPEHYRNPFLAQAMVNLNMIDTIGSGIKRMFMKQRQRFFPMPDYDLSDPDRVRVRLFGKILDENYTRLLIEKTDLSLLDVTALDKVQKHRRITEKEAKRLRRQKLIEGRRPNLFVSAKIADITGDRAAYIRHRAFDKERYKEMIIDYLKEFGSAKREDIDKLILDYISDVLDVKQKRKRIANILFEMSHKDKTIFATGPRRSAVWRLRH